MIQTLVKQNASKAQPQDEYNAKYDALVARYEKAVAKHNKLEAEIEKRNSKTQQITRFIDQLSSAPLVLDEWDNQIWSLMAEKGTVNRDRSILFEFRSGKAGFVNKTRHPTKESKGTQACHRRSHDPVGGGL